VNAIELLKQDHKKVKDIFRQYERAGDDTKKTQKLAEEAFKELTVHSRIEEEIFYPAARKKGSEEDKELVAEGLEEHHVVEQLIEELQATKPGTEEFQAKFKVMTENVEHHIEEEENELFPDVQKRLKNELESLGEKMMRRKEELMAAGSR
jgi:hemerythrin superfamily protein